MPCCAPTGSVRPPRSSPGTRLVIPVYNAAAASAHPQRLSEAAPQAAAQGKNPSHPHHPGQQVAARAPAGGTLHFVKGPQPAKPPPLRVARKVEPVREAKGEKDARRRHKQPGKRAKGRSSSRSPPRADPKRQVADLRQARQCRYDDDRQPAAGGKSCRRGRAGASADTANPEFRWPAHGRIIQGFNAGGNDGINIAVPEGTAVKAAEDGVVAYAGDELKGYGKLVLIRHPNGFVSAYANNEDIR